MYSKYFPQRTEDVGTIEIPKQYLESLQPLPQQFFQQKAVQLAPLLLGKLLRKDDIVLQITEVEAYTEGDSACHARFGITKRTAPLFGPAGHAYVYLCYGIHNMLNVTCDVPGTGAACLIRACQPIQGLQSIMKRRAVSIAKPTLLAGPGKVGQALSLSSDWSNHPLFEPGGLEILDGPLPSGILVGPRVGINYADEVDIKAHWRFAMAETKWISSPKHMLWPSD